MIRSSFCIFAVSLALGSAVLAQEQGQPGLELRELEIVGQDEPWPNVFEPPTALDPGLGAAEMADRYAFRAADYAVQAVRFRRYAAEASWPGMNVYGDRYVAGLFEEWARQLDRAAERSRILSVLHRLSLPTQVALRPGHPRTGLVLEPSGS